MSVPAGRLQFFALEATDYLERLTILIERPSPPEGTELVRLVRALRGAALMAGLPPFANAAMAVEHIAKGFRDGQLPWDPDRVSLFADAVTVFRDLAGRAAAWSETETARAESLAARCRPGTTPVEPARRDDHLKPSVRSFVGREGAQIAGTLELAAQAVELGTPGSTPDVVIQRLQPVRGLAGLPALAPLPDLLDAIELAIGVVRDGAAPPGAADSLRAAARAVATLSRDIAERGKADGDDPGVIAGARALCDTFGSEDDVVPIQSLFVARDPDPIVRQGIAPDPLAAADPHLELTGLADRLRQGADQLASAPGQTLQALGLFGLALHLTALGRGMTERHPVLASLIDRITGAIRSGAAAGRPTRFASLLVETADELATVASSRNAVLFHDQFDGVMSGLTGLAQEPPPTEAATAEPVPIESLAPDARMSDESDVVPIESLAPDPEPAVGPSPFERSFSTYFRLVIEGSPPPPETDLVVVPIETLLYRGRAALERADLVRRELSLALDRRQPFPTLEPLVNELIDLVPLALAE
ncbi:MAG: hypothetical protein FJ206_08005 [Gemmatimonadetes bacterium]|nr:hypothetical protein [Gemmatimonadota bacterium]